MNTISDTIQHIRNTNNKIEKSNNRYENKNDVSKFDAVFKKNINTIQAEKNKVDPKLMDTCIEMESLFVAKMLKEMRKTVHKNEWINGGFAEEVFEDMLYDKYALTVSKESNLGLAKMLYRELSRK